VNILVVGLGSIGRRHARCLLMAGATSVSGFDPSPERRAEFAALLGVQVFDNEAAAYAAQPDLAVIASPNVFHAAQAMHAVQAGCAVLCEKPLAGDLEGAEALANAVRTRGAYFHMGSNWKHHAAFRTMKTWLDAGRIGRVTGAQALAGGWLPDWHPYEDYRLMYAARADQMGGAVLDTHEIDMLTWLLGPADTLVGFTAHSGALEIQTEDVAACALRMESGALATLLTDYIQRVPRRRYHISGDGGTMEWDLQDQRLRLHLPGKPDAEIVETDEDLNDMYVAQAARVLDDLRTGGAPLTGIDQALSVLRLQMRWRQIGQYSESGA
jgi:predicted dehydrogenase